jgi:hypothetical protein
VTGGQEALRMNDEIAVAAPGGDRHHLLGRLAIQAAARSDHRDLHSPPIGHMAFVMSGAVQ